MGELVSFAVLALSAMFVIVDPLGVVPLFLSLTSGDSPESREATARRASLVGWGTLLVFALTGSVLFTLIGVTLSAFKVAGGLLLLLTAIDQIRAERNRTRTSEQEEAEGAQKNDVSIVPLAMPMLAGPGSIATAMVLVSRAENLTQTAFVLIAITITMALAYLAMRLAVPLSRLLGPTGMIIIERLFGVVLAAIGVQFVLDGVLEALRK